MTIDTPVDQPTMDPGLAEPPAADEETPEYAGNHKEEISIGGGSGKTKKSSSSLKKTPANGAASNNKPKSSKKKKQPPREMNPKFKDVKESGSWGKPVSAKEKYIAIGVFAALVVGAIVAVVVVLTTGGEKEPEIITPAPKPTDSPSAAPTEISDDKLLTGVLDNVYDDEYTTFLADVLPLRAAEYEGLMDDPNASPQERAMSWLLYEDEWKFSTDATIRFAMASIFYQMGGQESWKNKGNWTSSYDLCEWEGISCEPITGNLRELDLQFNQVIGTVSCCC